MVDVAVADDTKPATNDDEIVREAVDRFKACKDWQGTQDQWTREDIKFANADARNSWQWPKGMYDKRDGKDLPCLTINNTRTHNDIIINAMSKNGFGAKVRPVGGKASFKAAQTMQSLIDRIQSISKGSTQRRKVAEQQVDGGIGYMLIETAYVSNKTRDQDIYLKASRDPTGVYLDPWIREPDGSDANFGFVFDKQSRKEFNIKHKAFKDKVGTSPLVSEMADWISDKEIMLCKYYRKKQKPDTFVWYEIDNGDDQAPTGVEKLASEIKEESGEEIYKQLMLDIREKRIVGGTRKVFNDEVEWFLIAGDTIIDRGDWAGKYVPICRAVGREVVIDNTLDRKGHTRPLIDANRMLNYNASMAVQVVAMQTSTPWLASARATEGQEQWKSANVDNFAVLLFNDTDDEAPEGAQTIAPPQRIQPPQSSPAYAEGMQTAERQMMMISGQWQSETGQQSNGMIPESGKAIGERKEQGDIATYHFTEHMSDMDRFIGVQLLDLIPKIYDTRRALQIEGEDGEKFWIQIDPDQNEVLQELKHEQEEENAAKLAFNPMLGEYECISDPGPSSATRRQEAWQALSMVMQGNQEIAMSCADLLFKYGDFEGADQLAERLQKEIKATKPYLFDDNVDPQLAAAQEQNKKLVALNSELMTKLADEKLKSKGYSEKRDIQAFDSETKRMSAMVDAIAKMVLTPQQIAQMQHELGMQTHDHLYSMIRESNQENIDNEDAEAEEAQ